jgi:hypothetical protein
MTPREFEDCLEESKQLARECLAAGMTQDAIKLMFALLLLGGGSLEDVERLPEDAVARFGNDVEAVRRFVESWSCYTVQ